MFPSRGTHSAPVPKPEPSGVSREELQKLVTRGLAEGFRSGQSQMSSSSAGSFSPGSIGRISEAKTCSEQTGREKRILLSSPCAITLGRTAIRQTGRAQCAALDGGVAETRMPASIIAASKPVRAPSAQAAITGSLIPSLNDRNLPGRRGPGGSKAEDAAFASDGFSSSGLGMRAQNAWITSRRPRRARPRLAIGRTTVCAWMPRPCGPRWWGKGPTWP